MAKPASVTVCEDSHRLPCAEETLSSPDLAGKLFPVVPAGIPLPVGHVGPVGPYRMTSPSDLTSLGLVGPNPGPVGLCGMPSPCDLTSSGPVGPITDPFGPVGPYVTRGPVGSYGMLSLCNSDSYPDQLVADGRWARMLHVARWARMGCYPRVTPTLSLISRWLMDRWARMSHVARWARMGCYPRVTLFSSLLMARWARMLHVARWAHMGCCPVKL